jgi:hypothetical protein
VSTWRTYGGWRRSRSLGVGNLDGRQTAVVLTSVVVPLLVFSIAGVLPGLVLGAVGLVAVPTVLIKRDGVLVTDLLMAWVGWQRARMRGETSYRGAVFQPYPRALDLPGVLAPTTLMDVEDPGRGRVGLVWNQASGWMSATMLLSPAGAILADQATIERQVASWGDLLAMMADDGGIQFAAATIELQPESGTQLGEHVAGRIDPTAPQLAKDVMNQLLVTAPSRSARVSARLTITCDPGRMGSRSPIEGAVEVIRSLSALPVSSAGADVLRRATAGDLAGIVRRAFDPAAADASPEQYAAMSWPDAGPIATEEERDWYEHEGCYSINYVLLEAPLKRVPHDVLLLSRDESGALLEREVNASAAREEYRRRTKRDATHRDKADADRAGRAAAEEAAGAGLVQFSIFVTTTVRDVKQIPEARSEVEKAARRARLKLRVARYGQAGVFAAGLPCGIYPPAF